MTDSSPAAQTPSSQYQSGLALRLKSLVDLTELQKACCDDIIIRLGEANGTYEKPNASTRGGLWTRVFADNWDTDCPYEHPGAIRGRRGVESMTYVGTWNVDLPSASTPSKRNREGGQQLSEHRKRGARAYIKPNLNWDDFGISFSVCDGRSANANAKYIDLKPGWTMQQARAEAIIHWDRTETRRVTEYNFSLAVYWARSRLLTLLRGSQANPRLPTPHGEQPVNLDELFRLVTCAGRMKEMATLADESERIASARPIRTPLLPDVCQG